MSRRPDPHPGRVALIAAALLAGTGGLEAHAALLRVEFEDPGRERVWTAGEEPVELRGRAEILGARGGLDLFLVLDTSKSLRRTDPERRLVLGAQGLAWNLLSQGRTRIGIVDVDTEGRVVAPLGRRRDRILEALEALDQEGKSNLAAGIRAALAGFEAGAERGRARVMLLFTDGLTEGAPVLRAAREARARGVAVHTILLGFETRGETLLREVAAETRGTYRRMADAAGLSSAFLDLHATGVSAVTLAVEGREPVPARIAGARFEAELLLPAGEHRVVARATSPGGATAEDVVTVSVRPPGCAELRLRATRDGRETASLVERHVEIVLDASNSMWGRMQGRTKLQVAEAALLELVGSLPDDLRVGLRAYGHQHRHQRRNCEDSELLVPVAPGSREAIRRAVAGLEPRGQTPLAHSLRQVAGDFGDLRDGRAVVLVTDGIESCGGDPVAAARELQGEGALPVHVIGFGLGRHADEDAASLRAIAEASGGRYLSAGSARELRDALAGTLGTAFRVERDGTPLAYGTLGADEPLRLDAGDYTVHLDAAPPFSTPVRLARGERLTLTLEVGGEAVRPSADAAPTGYSACLAPEPVYPAAAP